MRKRALHQDTIREIRNTLGRFFSIFLIVALGTAFFAGIKTTAPVFERTYEQYSKDTNSQHARLVSTYGFEAEDVEAIRALPGIESVYPTYQFDAIATSAQSSSVVTLLSYEAGGEMQNQPVLVSGRLPENENECCLDSHRFGRVELGQTITLSSGTDKDLGERVSTTQLTVVGRVTSPLYLSMLRGSSTLGSGQVDGFLLVHRSLFTMDVFTDVYVRLSEATRGGVFGDNYETVSEPFLELAKTMGEQRGTAWRAQTVAEAQEELAKGQKEYDDGVRTANQAFAKAQKTIDEGRAQLIDARAQIEQGYATLEQQRAQGQQQLDQYVAALAQQEGAYAAALSAFERDEAGMDPVAAETERQRLQGWRQQLDGMRQQLTAQQHDLDQGIAAGTATLEQSTREVEENEQKLEQGQRTLNSQRASTNRKLKDAKEKLLDAQREIDDIPEGKWYALGLGANMGFAEYEMTAERMRSLSQVFPVVFFLVAALVCLTTMTRMVDEQRGTMGTLKALGYSRADIAGKYLSYALIASLSGSVLGTALGMWLLPSVIFSAYGMMFSIAQPVLIVHGVTAVFSAVIAVGVTVVATLSACLRQLYDTPAVLMRPQAPKAGKLILLERIPWLWRRFSFSAKVTARNLFRYKKRLFMTLIGIAGCTALMLTGYGIRDSISAMVENQFGQVFTYDISVSYKDDLPQESLDYLNERMGETQGLRFVTHAYAKTMDFSKADGNSVKQAMLSLFTDDASMRQAVSLHTRVGQETVPLPETGAVITEKLSIEMKLNVGDTLVMMDGETRYTLPIVGIAENYVNHYVYMSMQGYQALTGKAVAPNISYLGMADAQDTTAQRTALLELANVTRVNASAQVLNSLHDVVNGLNSVIIVLILAAAALAFVVMYNLININIGERVREIATLKVLGFLPREVTAYVFRENVFLSLLGIGIGFVLGVALHAYVMRTVEVASMMFGRMVNWDSFLLAGALTFAFSMLVNVIMLPKLRKVDMVESLKTVE